jgi:hypothetical protein
MIPGSTGTSYPFCVGSARLSGRPVVTYIEGNRVHIPFGNLPVLFPRKGEALHRRHEDLRRAVNALFVSSGGTYLSRDSVSTFQAVLIVPIYLARKVVLACLHYQQLDGL